MGRGALNPAETHLFFRLVFSSKQLTVTLVFAPDLRSGGVLITYQNSGIHLRYRTAIKPQKGEDT